MITSSNHVHPWIFVGLSLMALAACPQDKKPGTTDDPENEDTTSDASTSTTTVASTSSGLPSTTTGETTAPSEPGTTSTSSASTTTLDPDTTSTTSTSSASTTTLDADTTTGGDVCPVDLTPSLALDFDQCDRNLVLTVTIHNLGTVDEVPAGIDVTFHEGTDASGPKLGTKPTLEPLPPGSSTDLTWVLLAPPAGESNDYYVEVDSGPGGGSIVECDENNNSAFVTDAACPD